MDTLHEQRAQAIPAHHSPSVRVFAYLDDLTLVVPVAIAEEAVAIVRQEITAIGYSVNENKMQTWTMSPNIALPQSLQQYRL